MEEEVDIPKFYRIEPEFVFTDQNLKDKLNEKNINISFNYYNELIVSEKLLTELKKFNIKNCDIESL